jgi:hypothetical protein
MSRRRAPLLPLALAVALIVAMLAATIALAAGGSGPVAPRFVSTEASKRAAREDVERRVAAVALPPGAERISRRSPLVPPLLRGSSPYYGLYPHPIWATTVAAVPGGRIAATRWFLRHTPPGSRYRSRTGGPNPCLWFELPEGRPALGARITTVCVAKAHGRTSVRIDAQSGWLEGRSRFERVPRGTRFMELTVAVGARDSRTAVIADPTRIAHTVGLVNSLPVLQHNTCVPGLEEPSPSAPRVEVRFRSSRGGWPIARVAGSLGPDEGCSLLFFWLRGRGERPLDEPGVVFAALREPIERLRSSLSPR